MAAEFKTMDEYFGAMYPSRIEAESSGREEPFAFGARLAHESIAIVRETQAKS